MLVSTPSWVEGEQCHSSGLRSDMRDAAARRAACQYPDCFTSVDSAQCILIDRLRQKWPKLAAFIDDSETHVLSYLEFLEQHRSKLHSTNCWSVKRRGLCRRQIPE
jgi:putative transposase